MSSSEPFDLRRWMFTNRSYAPIPFLIVMIWFARPTVASLIVGAALLVAGEMLRFWGVAIAGAETRTTGTVGGTYLITSGPFGHVRNPLYVGNMTMYLGIGVMSMALWPWLLMIAAAWFYLQYSMIVSREEEYLEVQFGREYAEYRKHVRRFVPRLTPYVSASPAPKQFSFAEGIASERRTLQAIGLVSALILAKFFYLLAVAG
jgi:protein-S-isoprenylcysteine O-methyltransferase Ste14